MSSIEVVVVVHPPFAWLVDWDRVVGPAQRFYLVTTPGSFARLAGERGERAFTAVQVTQDFSARSLVEIMRPWIVQAGDPSRVRILSMIEPVQLAIAEAREVLSVPGPRAEEARRFTNKLAMKAAMRGVADLLPRHLAFDRACFSADPAGYVEAVIAHLGLPVFLKPVAENSSLDTARIDSREALLLHLRGSRDDLELDEYVEGDGFHLDSVIAAGRIAWFGAGWYAAPQAETLRGRPLAGALFSPLDPIFSVLADLNARLLGSFPQLPDGCTHMEVLRRPDGRWVFLEVAARVPGSRIVEAYEIQRGVNLRRIHYQLLSGQAVSLSGPLGPYAGWYCPMKTEPGPLGQVVAPPFQSASRGEWEPSWFARTDTARTISLPDCLGGFVLWDKSEARVRRDIERLHGFRPYTGCRER